MTYNSVLSNFFCPKFVNPIIMTLFHKKTENHDLIIILAAIFNLIKITLHLSMYDLIIIKFRFLDHNFSYGIVKIFNLIIMTFYPIIMTVMISFKL